MWTCGGGARGSAFCETSMSCPDVRKKTDYNFGNRCKFAQLESSIYEIGKIVLIVWNKIVNGSISRLKSLDVNLPNNLTPNNNKIM